MKYVDLILNEAETSSYPIKGGNVEIRVREMRGHRYAFMALVNGQEVAVGEFQAEPFGNRGSVEEIVVNKKMRRRGIATAIYNHFENMGFRVVPSDDVRPDGQAFWRNRGLFK